MSISVVNRQSQVLTSIQGSLILINTKLLGTSSLSDEWNEKEEATKWSWNVESCRWTTRNTWVKVHKHVFATGETYGCLLMIDLEDDVIHVLKVPHDKCESVVFEEVRAQSIAACVAEMFNARNPPMTVKFLSCCVFVLNRREKKPAIRAEQKLSCNFIKTKLRDRSRDLMLFIPPLESDTLEAFELFSYQQSGEKFVVYSPSRVGELDHQYWTEPSFFRFCKHVVLLSTQPSCCNSWFSQC
jgi:hypothetical protein